MLATSGRFRIRLVKQSIIASRLAWDKVAIEGVDGDDDLEDAR